MTTNNPPQPSTRSSPQLNPLQIAQTVATWMRAGILIAFWLIAGGVTLGATYVAFRGIFWAVDKILSALGV